MQTMKAVVFRGKRRLEIEDREKPVPGAGEAVIRITTTSICTTDVASRRVDLSPLVTHQFALDDIRRAIDLFSEHRDGMMKVALHPAVRERSRLLEEARVPVMLNDEA